MKTPSNKMSAFGGAIIFLTDFRTNLLTEPIVFQFKYAINSIIKTMSLFFLK